MTPIIFIGTGFDPSWTDLPTHIHSADLLDVQGDSPNKLLIVRLPDGTIRLAHFTDITILPE